RLSIFRTQKLICQMCDALAHAHKQGVIHRDLKPSNIMIINPGAQDEKVKILDFGIAKVLDDQCTKTTKTGEIFGTPSYNRPEQTPRTEGGARRDAPPHGCVTFVVS